MKKITLSLLMILALNATAMAGDNKNAFEQAAYLKNEVAIAAKNAKDKINQAAKARIDSTKKTAAELKTKTLTQHVAAQEFANQNSNAISGGEAAGAFLIKKLASSQTKSVVNQKQILKPLVRELEVRKSNIHMAQVLLKDDPEAFILGLPEAAALEKQVNQKEALLKKTNNRVSFLNKLAGVLALDALTRTGYTLVGKDVGVFAIDNAISDGASFVSDHVQAKFFAKPEATRSLADQPQDACEDSAATK